MLTFYGLEANEMGTLTLFARDAAPASQREIFHAYGLQHELLANEFDAAIASTSFHGVV
jgi:hypothetical protein